VPASVFKKLLFQDKDWGTYSTLDLTQTFKQTFYQFTYSTATCRVLLG